MISLIIRVIKLENARYATATLCKSVSSAFLCVLWIWILDREACCKGLPDYDLPETLLCKCEKQEG